MRCCCSVSTRAFSSFTRDAKLRGFESTVATESRKCVNLGSLSKKMKRLLAEDLIVLPFKKWRNFLASCSDFWNSLLLLKYRL